MFAAHFPGFEPDEVPIGHITNGVHAETWTGPRVRGASTRAGSATASASRCTATAAMAECSDDELGAARDAARARLVARRPRGACAPRGRRRGLRDGQLAFVDGVLDPHALTIGFARRVPTYKRLTLMLRDPERLERLLLDPERPVQIVIAGKAHPDDAEGKAMIAELGAFAARPDLRHRIVILADYDMAIARVLVAGVDVWLNNPLRPFEACGTSGMKAALNGALNVSILDGWWDERYDGRERLGDPVGRRRLGRSGAPRRLRGRGAVRPAGARDRRALLRRPRRPGCRWCGTPSRCSRPTCSPRGCCATTSATCTRRPPPSRGA